MPEYLAAGMETTGNFGLSQGTWKAYGTVDRHLKACCQDTGRCGRFPLPPADVDQDTKGEGKAGDAWGQLVLLGEAG